MSMTLTKINALDTFIKGEKTAARWDKMKRLYFPVWQLAAANAICMKSLTSGTFNGSILHEAKGVNASGITGNMNSNTNLGSLGVTNTSFHFALLMPNGPEEDYSFPFSVNGSASHPNRVYHGWSDSSPFTAIMEKLFGNSPTINASVMTVGNDSNAGNLYLKERTSVGVNVVETIAGSVTTAFPANNLFIIGLDNQVGAMGQPIGAFSVSTEFSSTQDTAYTAALKTVWETCTGFTIA